MDNGDLSISLAAKIATEDHQTQRRLLTYTAEELSKYFARKSLTGQEWAAIILRAK